MPQTAALVAKSPSDAGNELVERAHAMIPKLRARVAETDRLCRLPDATVDELMQAGFFTLCLPRAYGGHQVPMRTLMHIVREIARGEPSAAWVVAILNVCAWIVLTLYPKNVTDEIFAKPESLVAGVLTPHGHQPAPAPKGLSGLLSRRFYFGLFSVRRRVISIEVPNPEANKP